MLKPKFGYRYLGPYSDLENQLLYDKNTGDIYTYYNKPKNILDKIASRHDTCYSIGKNRVLFILSSGATQLNSGINVTMWINLFTGLIFDVTTSSSGLENKLNVSKN